MENVEIKQLSDKDLKDKLAAEKEALHKLKISHAVSPVENPMKIRFQRRVIARLESELRRRELESATVKA